MVAHLWEAVERGVDPYTKPLFEGAEFARERAFLFRDRDVFREDVARGQVWRISMPGGPTIRT